METEQVNRYAQNPEYFENLDKRSKEYKGYKKWKENYDNANSIGLGDVVEKVTKATGIKKLVKFVAGEDCGCSERKERLNKKVKLRFNVTGCFTEETYNNWIEFRDKSKKGDSWVNVTISDQLNVMFPIFEQLFNRSFNKPLSCCADQYLNEIDRVFEQYNN